MMKKRNVAIAMAAVTLASSVAPAFASSKEVEKYDVNISEAGKLVSKVRELLGKKYDDKTEGSVYTIKTNYKLNAEGTALEKADDNDAIQNATEFANIINAVKNEILTVSIIDNGHSVVDGKTVSKEVLKYTKQSELQAEGNKIGNFEEVTQDNRIVSAKYDVDKGLFNVKLGFYVSYDEGEKIEELKNESSLKAFLSTKGIGKDVTVETCGQARGAWIYKSFDVKVGSNLVDIIKKTTNESGKVTNNGDIKVIVEGKNTPVTTKSLIYNGDQIALDNVMNLNPSKETVLTKLETSVKTLETIKGLADKEAQRIPEKEVATINLTNATLSSVESTKLFDGLVLSEDGKKISEIIGAKENGIVAEIDGKSYKITATTSGIKEVEKDKKYEMTVAFKKTLEGLGTRGLTPGAFEELTITAGTRDELVALESVLTDSTKAVNDLVGSTRFTTAIKVSNELFPEGNAKSIVLVEKDSIVDGLAATPLATMTEAPVLFTDKNLVPSDIIEEMKRALNLKSIPVGKLEETTVYVVGGENKIDDTVINQIKRELGVTVKRLAGVSRTETSVKIAEEMKAIAKNDSSKRLSDKVFVVGKLGEADAMSIAGYAASQTSPKSPIIVSGQNELTKTAADFISKEAKTADIIGGSTVVKPEIEAELVKLLDNKKANVDRVEGLRREDTNANVINKYYKLGVNEIIVAKDGKVRKSDLSDSLVAGPLSAKNNAPIVLTTTNLSTTQEEVLELKAATASKLTQVGGGVARTVVEKLAKMVGLVK